MNKFFQGSGKLMDKAKRVVLSNCIIWSIVISLFSFIAIPTISGKAQTSNDVIYDYVILIDTSGSMEEGTPTIFSQVQTVAKDFIYAIQDGSNLVIYTFDTTFTEVGTWNDLHEYDKAEIQARIDSMNANGEYTALWDTVCEGLTRMEEMGQSGGQHVQLLISYTDGEDNISKADSSTCLGKYEDLHKEGYAYWIYNAIGGADVPEEIDEEDEIIGIIKSNIPQPIQVIQLQPLELNLGNLYQTGFANTSTSCVLFWASDESLYGQEITFAEPPDVDRSLPAGNAIQICAEGTDCDRTMIVSTSASCLQLSLLNYVKENLASTDLGEYGITVPLTIVNSSSQNQVFLLPNVIKMNFSLNLPPTPTTTPTKTRTPTLTQTPLPLPTATPLPPDTSINCGGSKAINAGVIQLDRSFATTLQKFTCQLDWKKYTLSQSIGVTLRFDEKAKDNKELANFIWLSKNGEWSKSLKLTESDPNFDVIINVPQDQWKNIGNGNQSFVGELFLQPVNTSLSGDIDVEKLSIPVLFQLRKPISLLTLALIVGGIVILLLLIFIPKIISTGKPPTFQAVLTYENKGNPVRINLMNNSYIKVDRNHSKIIVGQSSICNVMLPLDPELGGEYFFLEAEKTKEKVEISIIPVESIMINELPVSTKKVLKSKDSIKINDHEFHIIISNT